MSNITTNLETANFDNDDAEHAALLAHHGFADDEALLAHMRGEGLFGPRQWVAHYTEIVERQEAMMGAPGANLAAQREAAGLADWLNMLALVAYASGLCTGDHEIFYLAGRAATAAAGR